MLDRSVRPRRVLLQTACAALEVACRSEQPGDRWLKTELNHTDFHGQTLSEAHDPQGAGRGAVKGCSIRYPLQSMQGTGLLGIPAEPLSWVRIYLAASRLEGRAGAQEE